MVKMNDFIMSSDKCGFDNHYMKRRLTTAAASATATASTSKSLVSKDDGGKKIKKSLSFGSNADASDNSLTPNDNPLRKLNWGFLNQGNRNMNETSAIITNNSNYIYRNPDLAPNEWIYSFTDSLGRKYQPKTGYRTKREAQIAYNGLLEQLLGTKEMIAINDTLKRKHHISFQMAIDPQKMIKTKLTKEQLESTEKEKDALEISVMEARQMWLSESKNEIDKKAKEFSTLIQSTTTPSVEREIKNNLVNICTSVPVTDGKVMRFPLNNVLELQNILVTRAMAVDQFALNTLMREMLLPFPKEKGKSKGKSDYSECVKILNNQLEKKYLDENNKKLSRAFDRMNISSKGIVNSSSSSSSGSGGNKDNSSIPSKRLELGVRVFQLWWNTQYSTENITESVVDKWIEDDKRLEELVNKKDMMDTDMISKWTESRSGKLYHSKDATSQINLEQMQQSKESIGKSLQKLRGKYAKKLGDDNLVFFDTMIIHTMTEIAKANRYKPYVHVSPVANIISTFQQDHDLVEGFLEILAESPLSSIDSKKSLELLKKLSMKYVHMSASIDPVVFEGIRKQNKNVDSSLAVQGIEKKYLRCRINNKGGDGEWMKGDGAWTSNPDEAAKSFFLERVINPSNQLHIYKDTSKFYQKEEEMKNLLFATRTILKNYNDPKSYQDLALSAIPSSSKSIDLLCRSLLHPSFFQGKNNENLELVMRIIESLFKIDPTLSTSITLMRNSPRATRSEIVSMFDSAIDNMSKLLDGSQKSDVTKGLRALIPQIISNLFLLTSERIVAKKILMKIEQDIEDRSKIHSDALMPVTTESLIGQSSQTVSTADIVSNVFVSNFSTEWIQYPDEQNIKVANYLKERIGIPHKFRILTDVLSLRNGVLRNPEFQYSQLILEPHESSMVRRFSSTVCLHGLPRYVSTSSVKRFFEILTGTKITNIELFHATDSTSMFVDSMLKKLTLDEHIKKQRSQDPTAINAQIGSTMSGNSEIADPVLLSDHERLLLVEKNKQRLMTAKNGANQKIIEMLDLIAEIEKIDGFESNIKASAPSQEDPRHEFYGKGGEYFKKKIQALVAEQVKLRNISLEILHRMENASYSVQKSWKDLNKKRSQMKIRQHTWPKTESSLYELSGYEGNIFQDKSRSNNSIREFFLQSFGDDVPPEEFDSSEFVEKILNYHVDDLIALSGKKPTLPSPEIKAILYYAKEKIQDLQKSCQNVKNCFDTWKKGEIAYERQQSAAFALDDEMLSILDYLRQVKQKSSASHASKDVQDQHKSVVDKIEEIVNDDEEGNDDEVWDPISEEIESSDSSASKGSSISPSSWNKNDILPQIKQDKLITDSDADITAQITSSKGNIFDIFNIKGKMNGQGTMLHLSDIMSLQPANDTHAFIEFEDKYAIELLLSPSIRAFGMSVLYNAPANDFHKPKAFPKPTATSSSAAPVATSASLSIKSTLQSSENEVATPNAQDSAKPVIKAPDGLLPDEISIYNDLVADDFTRTNYLSQPKDEISDETPSVKSEADAEGDIQGEWLIEETKKSKKIEEDEKNQRITLTFSTLNRKNAIVLNGLPKGMDYEELIDSLSKIMLSDPKAVTWVGGVNRKYHGKGKSQSELQSKELVSDGTCEIVFPTHIQARRAYEVLNRKMLFGKEILVSWKFDRD